MYKFNIYLEKHFRVCLLHAITWKQLQIELCNMRFSTSKYFIAKFSEENFRFFFLRKF